MAGLTAAVLRIDSRLVKAIKMIEFQQVIDDPAEILTMITTDHLETPVTGVGTTEIDMIAMTSTIVATDESVRTTRERNGRFRRRTCSCNTQSL